LSCNIVVATTHASLSVSIIVEEEFIQEKKQYIIKNSNKEKKFINKLRYRIGSIVTTSCEILKCVTQEFTFITENL